MDQFSGGQFGSTDCTSSVIVNDITNFCFRFLPKPYTGAFAGPKTKFLMSLTIAMSARVYNASEWR